MIFRLVYLQLIVFNIRYLQISFGTRNFSGKMRPLHSLCTSCRNLERRNHPKQVDLFRMVTIFAGLALETFKKRTIHILDHLARFSPIPQDCWAEII